MASIKYKDPKTGKFVRLPMAIIGGTGEDKTYVYTQNTVLWENTSTDSNFNAQTVALSSTDYDYLIIFCYRNANLSKDITIYSMVEKNKATKIHYSDYFGGTSRNWFRDVSVTQGKNVQFGLGYINGDNDNGTNNACLAPYKIIGCKYREVVIDKTNSSGVSKEEMLDLFYPIGCYFETSDRNFDPNTTWRRYLGSRWKRYSLNVRRSISSRLS